MSTEHDDTTRFGTFTGVFRPTVLTILGAMLYLREGWLVGQAGLLGALLIIGVGAAITGLTALSLASIASNVRVRPGGAFAIIAQALGLEAGGAIGVPLYIAQAVSAAMYLYAFAESWGLLFPAHPTGLVAAVAFAAMALLAWRSASLALRAQAVLFVVVGLALVSAAAGLAVGTPLHSPTLLGASEGASLARLFAIFFPAFTGVMVGVGMSGALADPRRSIPRGTLLAWTSTTFVYVFFAFWYALVAPVEQLNTDRGVMISHAAVPPLVLAGLLSSTLMATLSSLVAAPRLLQAMAEHNVVPAARWLATTTASGEPRNAALVTTLLAAAGLAAGSLDAIAPVITSFFIMTYLAINSVVYLEMSLGMISFRPSFRVPPLVPLLGAGLCLLGLSVSSPFGGIVELLFVVALYAALSRRHLATPWDTARSGVTVNLAAWAARRAAHLDRSQRAWKPDLIVPVATVEQVDDMRPLVEALARRNGSIRWIGLGPRDALTTHLPKVVQQEAAQDLHAAWARLRTERYMDGVGITLDALRAGLFPPNLVVVDERKVSDEEIARYVEHSRSQGVGLALWQPHPGEHGLLGQRRVIDIWLSDRSPSWQLKLHLANLDLPVLVGYLLADAWGARLRLRTVVRDPAHKQAGERFLRALVDQARLPPTTRVRVDEGSFFDALAQRGGADLHLFGMGQTVSKGDLARVQAAAGGSCLWLMDNGAASALA